MTDEFHYDIKFTLDTDRGPVHDRIRFNLPDSVCFWLATSMRENKSITITSFKRMPGSNFNRSVAHLAVGRPH